MSNVEPFLSALAARRRFGMKPGLERMKALTTFMDHPERDLVAVHVAGTNGKGSVTAIVASILQEAGFGRVGRYTSPHLVYFNERICIDGEPVSDAVLASYKEKLEKAGHSFTAYEKNTDPAVASLLMSLEAVFSALAGWVILHEALSARELLGCMFVFLAVILAELPVSALLKKRI